MAATDAPTRELGYPSGISPSYAGIPVVGALGAFVVDSLDGNTDLRFPLSAMVYDRMRREDGQIASVLRAITLPIRSTRWTLQGDDVRPEVIAFLNSELGLEADAGQGRRRREGIVWSEHLREALLCLPFGFMPFEQVYTVGPAAPGLTDPADPGRLYAHLNKLAPRMPRTLSEVRVRPDGGLDGIVQVPPMHATGAAAVEGVTIPVDRLIMYVNEREGAEWTGTSVLRAAYKHWLIKDTLIRLGAQIVERNGMGVPVVTYAEGQSREEALALARAFRAGSESGVALAEGQTITLLGVAGTTADEMPRIKYHDEAVSRSLLAMFLDLGHDRGAQALGETFLDIFLNSLEAITTSIGNTATEHIVRDLVELNYGPDEPYPSLVAEALSSESKATAEALAMLAKAGLITPDRDLEDDVRRRLGLPELPEPAVIVPAFAPDGSPIPPAGPATSPVVVPAPPTGDGNAALTARLEQVAAQMSALSAHR